MHEPTAPIVKPCFVCGLPLLKEHSQYDPPKNLSWRCNNEKDCTFREYYDYSQTAHRYRDSAVNPNSNWVFSLKVIGTSTKYGPIYTNITFTGTWVSTSFDTIIRDAQQFAQTYDLTNYHIENEAGDILYEG
jgi:hypothetical protein